MSDIAHPTITQPDSPADNSPVPLILVPRPYTQIDFASILGIVFAIGMIAGAIAIGNSDANFFNVPSLMIVLFGTLATTAISFTGAELARAGRVVTQSLSRQIQKPARLALSLVDIAVVAKKKGILALTKSENELRKIPFLIRAIQMVIDGYEAGDIDRVLTQEIDAVGERHKRAASILRRAAEIAPAMGLIGTLIGLVQMLSDLENPEVIGPAMAIALLTTFYGAILGTIIAAPLAAKLEKNSRDEMMIKTLIRVTAVSIARQENPRRTEMLLNAELPPSERIRYFD